MKKKLLLLSVCLVITHASSAFAAVTLKHLGTHPFSRPAITSEADLRSMVKNRNADLRTGFAKAGNPELFPEFMAQFPTANVESIKVAPGEQFNWMLFRKKATGPVTVIKDVTWGGEAAFDAFRFSIDKDGQRYEFIVPAICGNLSLNNIGVVPEPIVSAPPVNQSPACSMTLSHTEIACGQVISVDASGSTDPEGSISEVGFTLVDADNQVVAEKIDKETPFIQEFTIPCESSRYTVKAVVVDDKGAQSSPAECSQSVTVAQAQRQGGPVVDAGLTHQFDPASYVFARGGYEVFLTEKLSAMGLVGGFARIDGYDGGSAFTADALLNYYFTEKMFAGAGVGFWTGEDDNVDLIVNMGYLIYEKPDTMKTSLFIEGRCEADNMITSKATRVGMGLRFQF